MENTRLWKALLSVAAGLALLYAATSAQAAEPLRIGHRGAPIPYVENTLRGFDEAAAQGADLVEADVRFTRTGVPVMFHDARLDRTTDGTGRLDSRSWGYLKRRQVSQRWPDTRAERTGRIPLLKRACERASVPFLLDLKDRVVSDKIIQIVSEYCPPGTQVVPNTAAQARYYGRHGLSLVLAVKDGSELSNVSSLSDKGYEALSVRWNLVDPDLVQLAHAAGQAVYAWTLRPERRFVPEGHACITGWALELQSYGVDGLITDQLLYE